VKPRSLPENTVIHLRHSSVVADWNELDPAAHLNTPDAGAHKFGRSLGRFLERVAAQTKINIDRQKM
jgi:uncharacterized protein (DUF2267 family)